MPDIFSTSIRLPSTIKAFLKRKAKSQGCSISWLIVDVLTKWMKWCEEQEKK